MNQAWDMLAASGPLAIILGVAVTILWKSWRKEQEWRRSDQVDCLKKQDEIREHYEGELKKERDENKSLYRELGEILGGLIPQRGQD